MSITARYGDDTATLAVTNDVLAVQLAHRSVRRFLPHDVSDDVQHPLRAARRLDRPGPRPPRRPRLDGRPPPAALNTRTARPALPVTAVAETQKEAPTRCA